MLETFLVVFLASFLGNFIANWIRGEKTVTYTYISTPKGLPKNITRIIKEHEELIKFVRLVSKYFIKEINEEEKWK